MTSPLLSNPLRQNQSFEVKFLVSSQKLKWMINYCSYLKYVLINGKLGPVKTVDFAAVADWQPFYPPGKATKRVPVGVKLLNFGVSDTVSKTLCGGESVVFKTISKYPFEPPTWRTRFRVKDNGGPGACPQKFLEIHNI